MLPPLPAPKINGRVLELLKTPPPRSESSQYYTASWGSPYDQPVASERPRLHARTLNFEASEDSPARHLEFHTPFLRPAPTFTRSTIDPDFVSQDGLVSAAVLANRARRPAQGLTEDWIRQHTGGESAENNAWLSDDPGESEHSSLSGSISGEGGDWLDQENDPRTPTVKRFLETRKKLRNVFAIPRRRNSTETLKQEDFSYSVLPTMSTTDENVVNNLMGNENSTNTGEDGAPALPLQELPDWSGPSPSKPQASNIMSASPTASREPRLKKKVPWRGKNIMVLLPWDDERGQKGKAPSPMTQGDYEAKLADWEQKGYNTAGFNLGHGDVVDPEGGLGQSRGIWPHTADIINERAQRSFKVGIPDRRGKLGMISCTSADRSPIPASPMDSIVEYDAFLPSDDGAIQKYLQHYQLPFFPLIHI